MHKPASFPVMRYGVALSLALVATAIRVALRPWLGDQSPFLMMYPALVCAAWLGGFGPSLLALVVGGACAAMLLPPFGSLRIDGLEGRLNLVAFFFVGLVISAMGKAMRSAQERASERASEAVDLLAAENEIRERLAITLRSIGDAVLATDAEGRVADMNTVAETLTGWTLREAAGLPVDEVFRLINESTGLPIETPVARVLREGVAASLEADSALISRDGQTIPIEDSAAPIRDDAGTIRGVVLAFRDDAVRRKAQRALRESEARKAAILESAIDCIVSIDDRGAIVEFNPAAVATFGHTRAEALGRDFSDLIIPERLRESHRRGMARYLTTGDAVVLGRRIELPVLRADGTEFPVEVAITRIKTDGPPCFTAYLRDITEARRDAEIIAEQIRLAELGRDVGLALTESATNAEMLDRCAAAAVRRLEGAFARIWTLDETGETLELQASAGIYTHLDGPHGRVPVGRFKIGQIALDRKPHLTNRVIGDPLVPAQEWAAREGMVAFAGYPLIVDDRLIGVWALFARKELSEATLRAMESVSTAIALGIERKRAAEELARSAAWLSTTLRSIGDAVIATDAHGLVRFLNPVAESLTGWTQAEARGRPIEEAFHIVNGSTREPAEHPVSVVIRDGLTVGLANDTVLISRPGPETPIEDSAAPIRDENGDLAGVVMVFRDVTDRRRAVANLRASEEQLRGAEERLRLMVESVRDYAIFSIDLDSLITSWNTGAERVFGYPEAEILGSEFARLFTPEDRASGVPDGELAKAAKAGRSEDERWHLRKEGVRFYASGVVTPILDESGTTLGFTKVARDDTARKRMEEDLRAAKIEAEQANRAKDHFLAVLSHELRTPLNPILLAASSMLDRTMPPEEVRPTLEMIRHNVTLQARLIDDLLDVMRIILGKMPLHWEVADCHAVIDHAIQVCTAEVSGKHIQVIVELAAGRHYVNADPARLQQVFWNLIKNAVKFTPDGGSLAIRTYNAPDDSESLVVEVADTGIGIDSDVLPRIFDPFQQGESSITRKFGGLGLGLTISRGVIESHGGTITALSDGLGRGTTFRVTLKTLPNPVAEPNGQPRSAPTVLAGPSSPASRLRILVVEDDEATRRLMARLLRVQGHELSAAGTLAEAVALVADAPPFDLIISDVGLPDGSGLDLMRQVVATVGKVPAIALTGYGMEEDIVRSREAGFTAHMTKPIDFTKLEAMIRQVTA